MIQVALVVVLVAVAAGVAMWLRRHDGDGPEQGASWEVPAQLDRRDFTRPDAPWLVAVFSSSTCLACGDTWDKAKLLDSEAVAVQELETVRDREIHQRYGVDAVPMVVVADAQGVVRRSFVGPPTATDLWAALAELRDPGTVAPTCTHD